jgi:putative membrane protein
VFESFLVLRMLVSLAVNALALWISSALFSGVSIHGFWAYAIGAAVLAIANTIIKPVLALLTLPLIVFTFGIFYLLINIAMVALAEWIAPNFSIDGFWDYIGVIFIVWIVNWAMYSLIDAVTETRAHPA